jgi:hypothetical protein
VALQPSPTSMISSGHARPFGLAFVAPFQSFMTRFDSQPRATQPLVKLADACPGLTCCGPFRAIQFVCQTRITRVHAMEMPTHTAVSWNDNRWQKQQRERTQQNRYKRATNENVRRFKLGPKASNAERNTNEH